MGMNVSVRTEIEGLAQRLGDLSDQVQKLAECVKDYQSRPTVLPISTFAPEPYEIVGPINIVLRQAPGEFIASFVEADINASGETQAEAFAMAKDMILMTFDRLGSKKDSELGPGPLRQRQVLSALIRKID